MGTELATANDMNGKLAYARELADNGLLPKAYQGKPGNVLWAIEFGLALGIAPVIAMGQIHLMDGKPVASSTMIGGLVRRAGHRLRVEQGKDGARATIFRKDDPEFAFVAEWTIADAKRAGIDRNPTWSKYPAAMCAARAVTACARLACPEVLMGVEYTAEELGGAAFAEDLPAGAKIDEPQRWPDAERKAFCAELTSMGLAYEDVAEWCQSRGHDRPSGMSVKLRGKVLDALRSAGRGGFDAWLASKNAAAIDADGVVTDTEEFFDTPPQAEGSL